MTIQLILISLLAKHEKTHLIAMELDKFCDRLYETLHFENQAPDYNLLIYFVLKKHISELNFKDMIIIHLNQHMRYLSNNTNQYLNQK